MRFVAATASLTTWITYETTHSQQVINVGHGRIVGICSLIKPYGTQCIKGIGIEIREFLSLARHNLGPPLHFLRREEWLLIGDDRPQLGVTAGSTLGQLCCGPWTPFDLGERTIGEDLAYRLIVGGAEDIEIGLKGQRQRAG
jgi:hypothetical protein